MKKRKEEIQGEGEEGCFVRTRGGGAYGVR